MAFAARGVCLTNAFSRNVPDGDVLLQHSKVLVGGGQFLGSLCLRELGDVGFNVHRAFQLSLSLLAGRFRTAQLP